MASETEKPPGPGARRGRLAAQVLYFAFAGFVALASVVQITQQVFFPSRPGAAPFASCGAGLTALYEAIERGRLAAERGDDEDEEAALRRYRETVAPEWLHRDAIADLCRPDAPKLAVLDAIERLRYSEEHGVRHQAVELAALRRKVKELVVTASVR